MKKIKWSARTKEERKTEPRMQRGWKTNWSFNWQINWLEFLFASLFRFHRFSPGFRVYPPISRDKVARCASITLLPGKPCEFHPFPGPFVRSKNETRFSVHGDRNYSNDITFQLRLMDFSAILTFTFTFASLDF